MEPLQAAGPGRCFQTKERLSKSQEPECLHTIVSDSRDNSQVLMLTETLFKIDGHLLTKLVG